MATTLHTRPNYSPNYYDNDRDATYSKTSQWAVPAGRFLFSLIFIMSGISHFSSASIQYAASSGVPLASILVPISGLIAIAGGLSVLLGYHARFGAGLILLFMIPVTLIMHDFWNIQDAQAAQQQMAHFMKNISIIGGAVLMMFYGAGPLSLDHRKARKSAGL